MGTRRVAGMALWGVGLSGYSVKYLYLQMQHEAIELRARSTGPVILPSFQGLEASPWPRNLTSKSHILADDMLRFDLVTIEDSRCCVRLLFPFS